jgi:DNA polymerase III epsilon subunit-like protein
MNYNDVFKYKNINTPISDYHIKLFNDIQEKLNYSKTCTIILDTETDGKDKIVQIAYYILNENNNVIHSYNFFLNDGTHTLDYFRKFTTDFIKENGIDVKLVLQKLANDFLICRRIVCHNTQFDIEKMKGYFEKFNIQYEFPKDIYCTMIKSKYIVKALNKIGRIKNPKLSEVCDFFGVKYNSNEAHDGLYDVDVTYQCYKKLFFLNS